MNPKPTRSYKKRTIRERLLRSIAVNPLTGCWEWQRGLKTTGYGSFAINGAPKAAHRESYKEFKGPIGDKWVLHSCDNRPCINPEHLSLGTPLQNTRDMIAKGRNVPCNWRKALMTPMISSRFLTVQ